MIKDSKETDSPEHQIREKKSQELDQILKEQKELVIRLDNINIIIKDNPKILNENLSNTNQELSIWEDNVCSLRQWIKKKMPGISEKEINNNFGLPDDD